MDERDSENVFDDIIITHFINPSMFWYRVAAEPLPELVDLEQKLAKQFSTQKYLTQYEPKKNEIVAVYDVAGTRYCRARVEHVLEFLHEPNKYMLWAFDIGQLLQSRARFIKELPDELAQIQIENVYYGGLNNIVPAVQNFDFYQNMNVTEVVNKWSEKSCRVFEEVTKNAYSLQFVINRRIKDQYFGELKAALQYECMTSVNKLLVAQNDAKIVDDFVQQLNVLKLNQRELWLTNENDCHKYNQNNFKSNFEGLFKPNIGAKNDALTSFTPNSANTKEKKKINDEKDSELIEAEVALNQRINAWNTDNSELIKGKIEKHRNLKLIDENSSCNDRAHNNSGVYNTLDSDSIIANKCLSTSSVESQGIKNITNSTIGQKSKLAQLNKARALLSNKSSKIGSISENESLKDDLLSFNETASNIPNCDSTFEQNFDNISIIDSDINQKLNLPKNLNISSNISDKCSVQSEGSIQSSDRTSQLSARDKILARHKLTIKQKIAEASKPKIVLPAGFDLRSLPPGKAKPTIQLQNKDDDLLSFNNSSESNIPNCDSSLQQNFDMSIIDSDINQNMNLPTNINVSSNISDKCSPQSQGSIQSSDRTSQLSARDKILARHKFNLKLKIAEASKPKIVLPAGFDLRCLPPGRAKATIQLQNKDDDLLSFNDSSESNIPNCDSSLQQNFDMSIIDSDINQNMNLPTNLNVSHNISDKCSPKSEVSIQSSDRTSQLSARDKILARHKFNLKLKIVEASKPKPKIVLPAGFDLTCLPPGKAKPTVQVPTCRKDYWKPEHSFEESILIDLSDSGSISVDKNCIQSDQVLTPSKLNKTPDKLTTNSKTDFDSPLKNPFDIQSSDHIQKSNSGSKNSKEANSSNSKSKSPPLNQKGYNRYENRKSEEIKGTHNKDEQRNSYGRSNNQRQNNRSHQNNNRRSGNSNNSGSSTEAFEKENRNKNNNQNNRKTESPENRMSNSYRGRQNTNKPGFQEIDEIW